MTYVLGLTGSIGMGKSTTARMFQDHGVPVWDADAVVADLYQPGGEVAQWVGATFPDAMTGDAIDRLKLRALIADDSTVLDRLQAQVHPRVARHRMAFLEETDADIVVLDVPLLYETGSDRLCDGVVVVSASADEQRARVLARGQMTPEEFELILSRQMSDADKRQRADWVIETYTFDQAKQDVMAILTEIKQGLAHA